MKSYIPILSLVSLLLLISSCTGSANKIADEFYKAYNDKDVSKLRSLTVASIGDIMEDFVKGHYDEYGKVESYSKYYFNTDNNLTILNFKCKYEKSDKDIYERLSFVKEDNGELKIEGFVYSEAKWYIDDYQTYIEDSEQQSEKYFQYILNENYDKLATLLNDKSLEQAFIDIVNKKDDDFGKLKSYELLNFTSFLSDNKPCAVRTYKCISKTGNTFYEQLKFVKENDIFLIYDYSYNSNLDDLGH